MGLYGYSAKMDANVGKAQGHDMDASYKDLTQVCRAIKGKSALKALSILDNAISELHAIEYRKFNKGMGHRSELSGRKGRYPKKECRLVKAILQNAIANATNRGLEKDALYVTHAAAHKQNRFRRYRFHWPSGVTLGYGKQAMWADYETARVELAVSAKGKAPLKNETKTGSKTAAAEKKGNVKETKTSAVTASGSAAKTETKVKPAAAKSPAKESPVHDKTHAHDHDHPHTHASKPETPATPSSKVTP